MTGADEAPLGKSGGQGKADPGAMEHALMLNIKLASGQLAAKDAARAQAA